jgi:uncharacterized membrane protein
MDVPQRVVVVVYDDSDTAMRAYEAVRELDHEGKVKIQDAAVVHAHDDGQVEVISTHRHAVKSAATAAFWGLLLGGALTLPVFGLVAAGGIVGLGARRSDRAKEGAFADKVRALLLPGKTALFVTGAIGTASPEEVIAVLAPFGGQLASQSSLLMHSEEMFRDALREVAAQQAAEEAAAAAATPAEGAEPGAPEA